MSYTREQRAANAAKAAESASQSAAPESTQSVEPTIEPSEKSSVVRPAPRNDPRNAAYDEVAKRHEKTSGNTEPPVETPEIAKPEAPKPEAPAATPETPAPETPAVETPPAIEMVKVKIDGVESEVPKSEIDEAGGITAYQKDRAAENRLAKTNEKLAETSKLHAQMLQWMQQNQKPKEPQVTDDQFIQSKVDIIRFGTPEESAAALRDVMSRSNPKIDQNAITQNAVMQFRKEAAVDNFKKEFHDIISNPLLLRLAVQLENERGPIAARDPQTDWNTVFRSIGNEIRGVTGRPSQPAATPAVTATDTPSQVSEKEARKASIVNLPTASSRATPPAEEKPETRGDTLNSMRKARGLPTS